MSVTSTIVPTGTWTVDPAHSKVGFSVKHMGIATVRGVFGEFSGTLEVGDEITAAGSVTTASRPTATTSSPSPATSRSTASPARCS